MSLLLRLGKLLLFGSALFGCSDGNLYPVRSPDHPTSSDSDTLTVQDTDTPDGFDSESAEETSSESSAGSDFETESNISFQEFAAEDFDTFDFKEGRRGWYLMTIDDTPQVEPDPDENHAETARGGAYLEALPDLRVAEADGNIDGHTTEEDPASSPQIGYHVNIDEAGRYYIWVRAYTTGGKDDTLHVGIDGTWPDSGRRIQFPYESNAWVWSSNQRGSGGSLFGNPLTIYLDIETTGQHHITFAMREDGFEFDEWLLTRDPGFMP